MGLFEKVEGTITLGLLAVVGYVFIKNYDTIKELWCKIPGVCGPGIDERKNILDCYLTTDFCRSELGPYGDVDLKTCSCALTDSYGGITPINPIPPVIMPCDGKPMHYTVEEGLHCDTTEPFVPLTCEETCQLFGMHCNDQGLCVDTLTPIVPPIEPSCGDEIPPGSGCYPYSQGMNVIGQNCNVNCNTRCSDSQGNYRPCDVVCDGIWYRETCVDPMDMPCPEGQVRDPLGAHLCINDTSGCMINMQNGGWMTLETWRNSPGLWENNLFLGDNGRCSI